jgi:multidrug efflux pump
VIETQKAEKGPPTGKPIQVEFASRFPDLLAPAVEELVTYLQQRGGYKDIEDNRPVPEIEWELEVNRELAGRYGLDILTIGNFVKMVTNGIIVTDYRPDDADDVVDIILRFPEKYRNIAQLDNLRINTPSGDRIPISNFITRVPQQKISTLNRIDGRRVMTVKADLAPGILADARVKEIKQWMMEQSFDPNLQVIFRGEDEEQKEAGQFLTMAFVVALFTMALVMVTQFNSIYSMVVIMSAVFFSTGGVMLGLLIAWEPFGIVMCGVAIIALAGVVVNNNIIFIDTYDLHRADGLPAYEALLRTGAMRLRPILLTAVTTILGLVPMVFSMNIDFFDRTVTFGAPSTQWWVQLSTSIAGGLAFATFLTLIFTPCLLLLGDRYLGRRRQKTA